MENTSFTQIRASIKELTESQKETSREIKELRQLIADDVRARKAEREAERAERQTEREAERVARKVAQEKADQEMKELRQLAADNERAQKQLARRVDDFVKKSDERIKKLDRLFTGQWGKLVESLVAGDIIKLLQQKNIKVEDISERSRFKRNGKRYEFDIVAANGEEIVVVEVKTTLHVNDVQHFLSNMKIFRNLRSEYSDKKIYAAIAYIKVEEKADVYAESKGLFVIKATGSSASITNEETFWPKNF